jgi:probable DNA metabolism protein
MTTVVYDGTFEGWLTAVFDVYEHKIKDADIVLENQHQASVFRPPLQVITDTVKAKRVWDGLKQRVSDNALGQIYRSFLSEESMIENLLLDYVQKVFSSNKTIEHNYTNPTVLYIVQTAKKVYREKHRLEAFIRFQLTKDKLYYAICQPDFNVLPLLERHFKDRYADQRWLIYDGRRKYGLYYDLQVVEAVEINFSEEAASNLTSILDDDEMLYQQLWQQYFTSVNIEAHKNMKLHIQHMPKRYWRHLTEKQVR